MIKPLIQIGDEVREMTDEEYAQHLLDVEKSQLELQEQADKEAAKDALLSKLGISAEEAKLLLS